MVRSQGIHTSGQDGGRCGSRAKANGSTSTSSTSDSAVTVSSVYGSFTSKRCDQLPKTSSYSTTCTVGRTRRSYSSRFCRQSSTGRRCRRWTLRSTGRS
jgi:hypothetical protein